jgi:transcriptional regulator with XRE-family HTH domain
LAAGDTYSLIDMAALRAAVKRSGLSYEDIAEATDISVSSIYKFFSKKSKSPSFFNVLMIFRAIGASVDDICGLHPKKKQPTPEECRERMTCLEKNISQLQRTMEAQTKLIEQLADELRKSQPRSDDDY